MRGPVFIQRLFFISTIVSLTVLPPAWAADSSSTEDLQQEIRELRDLAQKQQARIDELERKIGGVLRGATLPPAGNSSPAPAVTPPAQLPPAGAAAQSRPLSGQIGAVLPEIGAVGDIVATSSQKRNDTEGNDRISARELELVVGSYVDPYSRFDSTIAFSDQADVELEEAYLTRWGLPGDVKARFGKFFPRVGKEASAHRDSLSTVDEPFVIRNFFGKEGFAKAGADLTRPFGGPFGWVLEPSIGVVEGGAGEDSVTFGSNHRRPTVYSHLKMFRELGDLSNLELGLTHLVGSKSSDNGFQVNVLGADATYTYHVTPTNKLLLQSEVYVQDRGGASSTDSGTGAVTRFDQHPWGIYLLGDYRFAPRWSAGMRLDQVRPVDTAASRNLDQGVSAFLTFYQSEFARWRLQVRHETDADRKEDNAVFLQGTFAIGTHKHALQ